MTDPFSVQDLPAALFYYGLGEHPRGHFAAYVGLMQADAFDGCTQFYEAQRKPGRSLKRPAGATAGEVCRPSETEAPIISEAVPRIDLLPERSSPSLLSGCASSKRYFQPIMIPLKRKRRF
jgi:transposase